MGAIHDRKRHREPYLPLIHKYNTLNTESKAIEQLLLDCRRRNRSSCHPERFKAGNHRSSDDTSRKENLRQYDVVLIFDEIKPVWEERNIVACEREGVVPDIMTLVKHLAADYAGDCARPSVDNKIKKSMVRITYIWRKLAYLQRWQRSIMSLRTLPNKLQKSEYFIGKLKALPKTRHW